MDLPPLDDDAPGSARDRIMATAHLLFYRDGIRATGVDKLIAESGVTKVTFYRHFPSKNELVLDFLEDRHRRWMAWFRDALERHRKPAAPSTALVPALAEWFANPAFRGCAFINAVGELGPDLPEVVQLARRHKEEMKQAIQGLLPAVAGRAAAAQAIAVAVDGAIFHAQLSDSPARALKALEQLIEGLAADHEAH